MREAFGNAFIYNMILTFVAVAILLLVGSISYSKGYKVKNRIINIIEKHEGFDENAKQEIANDLKSIGYRLTYEKNNCKKKVINGENGELLYGNDSNAYHYCVYSFKTGRGYFYYVTAFMHFDIPLVGQFIEFPIGGETRTIYSEVGG